MANRMSSTDRRRWANAQSFADLTELTARWLEGRIGSFPENWPGTGPDEETRPLIPALTALCRDGYLTTNSQPGLDERFRGKHWRQRAAVTGLVRDAALHRRLIGAASRAGLPIASHPVAVTKVDGRDYTWFGGCPDMGTQWAFWSGVSVEARNLVIGALPLTIIAPQYGSADQGLWHILTRAARP